jgi:hypothetical protein
MPSINNSRVTPDRLKEVLGYDASTGEFWWLIEPHHRMARGRFLGTRILRGYRSIKIDGFGVAAHRVAWCLSHGAWPEFEIDHINCDKSDNRLENLRCATRHENQRNAPIAKNNRSGYKGVYWNKSLKKWVAQIKTGGKNSSLGGFKTAAEASAAYEIEARKLFGAFARSR